MKRWGLAVALVVQLAFVGSAGATSCAIEGDCLCGSGLFTADVEVVHVEGPRTLFQVNDVPDGHDLAPGDTFQLARQPDDAPGQRRFVSFDEIRSVTHVIPVNSGEVTCTEGSKTFTFPADQAFEFAKNPSSCTGLMIEAGLAQELPCGGGPGYEPAVHVACSGSAGWVHLALLALWVPLLRRRQSGKI